MSKLIFVHATVARAVIPLLETKSGVRKLVANCGCGYDVSGSGCSSEGARVGIVHGRAADVALAGVGRVIVFIFRIVEYGKFE